MYPELLRQAPAASYTKARLPSDLLKQFHFVSPVHRLPSLAGKGQGRLIYSFLCVLPFSGENLALGSPQSDDCPLARPITPPQTLKQLNFCQGMPRANTSLLTSAKPIYRLSWG